MTIQTQQAPLITFAKLMSGLAELYDKRVSKAVYELYWFTLNKYGINAIKQAINTHIKNPDTGQFMPKPADLIKHIEGTAKDKALLAWSKVLKAITRVGAYESVVFDDAIIHRVIDDMGGWPRLCASNQNDLSYRGHDFMCRYQTYLTNIPKQYPSFLPGITSNNNTFANKVIVGDSSKAKLVYLNAENNFKANNKQLLH